MIQRFRILTFVTGLLAVGGLAMGCDTAPPTATPRPKLIDGGYVESLHSGPGPQTLVAEYATTRDYTGIAFWNLAAPQAAPTVITIPTGSDVLTAVSPDGHNLVVSKVDGSVRRWDLQNPSAAPVVFPVQYASGGANYAAPLAISPDGKWVAMGSPTGVDIWDMAGTGAAPEVQLTGQPGIYPVFSPDGHWLASANSGRSSDNRIIQVWDLRRPVAPPATIPAPSKDTGDLVIDPASQALAAVGGDGYEYLWQINALTAPPIRLTRSSPPGTTVVTHPIRDQLAFSPDGRTLAGTGDNGALLLWSLANPTNPPTVLAGGVQSLQAVIFAPDGQTVIGGDLSGKLYLWTVAQPTNPPQVLESP